MATRFMVSLPNPEAARGPDPALSFSAVSAEGFAEELQAALRAPALFERWRQMQPEPDEVNPALGATDADATVAGSQRDLRIDLDIRTDLPGDIIKQRLRWLAGSGWELRDVRAA
ncbi:hypothetical protein [Coralloluteibacterium stylophorae]|uniref:Uncharacterized protein n=1 Tax=Coralloluteibacterium stylophorae TaxID=1776034 RepID=A0AAP2FZI8_9GAMM|nr:hypothetical protein [Coralloluteibacterium stylophorae]MBS7458027.1 hypothetical protein [Coralloluteibacterium stylophorae]